MRKFRRLFHVLLFAIKWHGNQKRKYTGHPYWFHLVSVAYIVYKTTKDEISTVVAILHDLFEDTECPYYKLDRFLSSFYTPHAVKKIIKGVEHLTDEYVRIAYPEHNRKKRKQLEAERLGKIPNWVKTIKLADLIDNSKSIVKHDKDFAIVYLKEKEELLKHLKDGNLKLYLEAVEILDKGKKELNIV